MGLKFHNFLRSTIATDTVFNAINIIVNNIERFPPASTQDYYFMVISPADGSEEDCEIVQVVNVTPDNNRIQVRRGKQGTTARAWPAGSKVELRLTAEVVQRLWDASGIVWDGL